MWKYTKLVLAALALCGFAFSLSGCTVTTGCYGYRCGMPYDYSFDAERFTKSGTEQPTYRHYRPVW